LKLKLWFGSVVLLVGCLFQSPESEKLTEGEKLVIGGWKDTLPIGNSPDVIFLQIHENKNFIWDFVNLDGVVDTEWKGTWYVSDGSIFLELKECRGDGPDTCAARQITATVNVANNRWQSVFKTDSSSILMDFARVY
jgi:hypothetical protein